MKLHNKKTGAIGDLLGTYNAVPFIGIAIDYHDGNPVKYEYDSLAELNEDWEDYKPAEPLINDEKIRKAVRAWAEANNIIKAQYRSLETHYLIATSKAGVSDLGIDFKKGLGLESSKTYTIVELCGEEE